MKCFCDLCTGLNRDMSEASRAHRKAFSSALSESKPNVRAELLRESRPAKKSFTPATREEQISDAMKAFNLDEKTATLFLESKRVEQSHGFEKAIALINETILKK